MKEILDEIDKRKKPPMKLVLLVNFAWIPVAMLNLFSTYNNFARVVLLLK